MQTEKKHEIDWTDRIQVERHSDKNFVRVEIPFTTVIERNRHKGVTVSTGDFVVRGRVNECPGKPFKTTLAFDFRGFSVSVTLWAQVGKVDSDRDETEMEIVEIGDLEHRLLRNMISSYLSGTLISFDDVLSTAEQEATNRQAPAGQQASVDKERRGWFGRLTRYGALASFSGGLLAVAALAAYDNFYVLEASFAATTAPRIDIRAPGAGLFDDKDISPGTTVQRDGEIGRIYDTQLQADLAIANATLIYQEELESRLSEALKKEDTDAIQALSASIGAGASRRGKAADVVNLLAAESRIEELNSQNNLQRAHINALKQRASANTVYSPCDCVVHWARGSSGRTWVSQGEKLFELVPTGDGNLMIEAQIPMDYIPRVERLQRARIEFLNRPGAIEGRVVEINLEGEHRPRAGFPKWVRQDLSKATVLIQPDQRIDNVGIGVPVKVSFPTVLPDVDTLVRELESLAGKSMGAVANGVDQLASGFREIELSESLDPDPAASALAGRADQ